MATKTISIDLEAYDKLAAARNKPRESFSSVIKRARWDPHQRTANGFLRACKAAPIIDEETLDRLDQAQATDMAPEAAWQND